MSGYAEQWWYVLSVRYRKAMDVAIKVLEHTSDHHATYARLTLLAATDPEGNDPTFPAPIATGEPPDPLRDAVEVASGGAIVIRCVSCSGSMLTTGYVEHHDDGSHTFTPIRALSPATLPPSCPGGDECPHEES